MFEERKYEAALGPFEERMAAARARPIEGEAPPGWTLADAWRGEDGEALSVAVARTDKKQRLDSKGKFLRIRIFAAGAGGRGAVDWRADGEEFQAVEAALAKGEGILPALLGAEGADEPTTRYDATETGCEVRCHCPALLGTLSEFVGWIGRPEVETERRALMAASETEASSPDLEGGAKRAAPRL